MKVILYSTNCPKCNVLEKKMTQKNVEFEIVNGTKEIVKMGYLTAPLLKVDDKIMEFKEANDWVNSLD